MPPTQNSGTTFKLNQTCIFLSAKARCTVSNPNETPCRPPRSVVLVTNWKVGQFGGLFLQRPGKAIKVHLLILLVFTCPEPLRAGTT